MVRNHSNKLRTVLVVGLFTLSGGAGDKITPADCKQAYEDGYLYYCEAVKCACDLIPGAQFWHDGGEFGCGGSDVYGCLTPRGELFCYYGNEGDSCYYTPHELLNPDRNPDSPNGPTIGDAGQVVTPVESGPGIPGAVGGGPGTTEFVETDTGDDTGAFDPGAVFQAGEVNAWFAPGAYGRGEDFQMDAFLSDAPLDYLEALLDLQTLDLVRPEIPVSHYLALRQAEDPNGNGIPVDHDNADPIAPNAHNPVANNDLDTLANAQAQTSRSAAAGGMCGSGAGLALSFGLLGMSCMTTSTTGRRKRRIREDPSGP